MATKLKVDKIQSDEVVSINVNKIGEDHTMAISNVSANAALPVDNNEFTIPEEFTIDDTPLTHSSNRPDAIMSEGGLTLEQLNEIGFNDSRDEVERQKLNPPTGDWEKEDRWKLDKRVNTVDSQPGDIDINGRTFINVMGKPKPRVANDLEYQPMLFLRLSPDIRYKQDKPNEVDMGYKLFLRAKDMYIELHGEKARKLGQLATMLEEDSYVIRTINGDNGAVVVDLKAKRVRR